MTGAQLKSLKFLSGLSDHEFGRALGYTGSRRNVSRKVRRLETFDQLRPEETKRATDLVRRWDWLRARVTEASKQHERAA